MASSRVFVRGLPPTLTETDFKKHFSQQGNVTDARLFQNRRIGYIGYDSPEIARKAVKYFNRTYMRMSKIGVEVATPVVAKQSQVLEATKVPSSTTAQTKTLNTKRKRGHDEPDQELSSFLEVMRPNKTRQDLHSLVKGEQPPVEAAPATEDLSVRHAPPTLPIKRRKVDPGDDADAAARDSEAPCTKKSTSRHRQTLEADQPMQHESSSPKENEQSSAESAPRAKTSSDADWLRSRTSRLLGLEDDEEDEHDAVPAPQPRRVIEEASDSDDENGKQDGSGEQEQLVEQNHVSDDAPVEEGEVHASYTNDTESRIRETRRLYIRNLAYDVTDEDLQTCFASFGRINEVHIPVSGKTGTIKGFAYILFENADTAVDAWRAKDGTTFKGRLLHILPATAKRDTQLDDFALSKLPLKKQQQIKKRREAASTQYNWNSLYMNTDTVLSAVADRFGISKSDMLDPTSSNAAVKQAHAETHLIQETKSYFKEHNVDLDAFKSSSRGDTAILIKNIPHEAKASEIRDMFEQHGKLKAFLVPPSGVIAIAAYEQAGHAKAAFAALAYRKLHNSVLFLEKGPKNLFSKDKFTTPKEPILPQGTAKTSVSASELRGQSEITSAASATLFVRNLNFTTTTERLVSTFKSLDGFVTGRVKTKTDARKPGQTLSMGFGFVEFKTKAQAQAALATMNDYNLEGHRLQIRISQKATDSAEARRAEDRARRTDNISTKIVIKNLPFEATKRDIHALFGAYGQLRTVRMPLKLDKSIRGFAFAEFTTQKEATNAIDALRDTHLLGRRLVLDYAAPEAEDAEAEIEKMQKKVGSQINKVALQRLTGGGRQKFSVDDPTADHVMDE